MDFSAFSELDGKAADCEYGKGSEIHKDVNEEVGNCDYSTVSYKGRRKFCWRETA